VRQSLVNPLVQASGNTRGQDDAVGVRAGRGGGGGACAGRWGCDDMGSWGDAGCGPPPAHPGRRGVTIRRRRTCSCQKAVMTSASWSPTTSTCAGVVGAGRGLGGPAEHPRPARPAGPAGRPGQRRCLARPTSAWSDPPLPAVNIQAAATTAPNTSAATSAAASHRRHPLTMRSVPDPPRAAASPNEQDLVRLQGLRAADAARLPPDGTQTVTESSRLPTNPKGPSAAARQLRASSGTPASRAEPAVEPSSRFLTSPAKFGRCGKVARPTQTYDSRVKSVAACFLSARAPGV
jgi:hypothetical protein